MQYKYSLREGEEIEYTYWCIRFSVPFGCVDSVHLLCGGTATEAAGAHHYGTAA